MAVQNKTIAASGGDYTSLSLGEAAIGASNADTWTFTYIEALTDTTPVLFSAASFTGSVLVTVQSAYRCNGAVSGAHASLTYSTANATVLLNVAMPNVKVEFLRIHRTVGTIDTIVLSSTGFKLHNCTVVRRHDATTYAQSTILANEANTYELCGNYFVVSGQNTNGFVRLYKTTAGTCKVYNNTIFQPDGSAGYYMQVYGAMDCDARLNVAVKKSGLTNTNGYHLIVAGTYNASSDGNVSSEAADAPGTNGANSASSANYITTETVNSENLDYPSYALMAANYEGADLSATCPTDIKGKTRENWYPGAHDVTAPAVASTSQQRFGFNFGMGF